jgi:hypothetical protein
MFNGQLELSFEATAYAQAGVERKLRRARAQSWFQRMRRVVDSAFDAAPRPLPRPEQVWFASSRRRVELSKPR